MSSELLHLLASNDVPNDQQVVAIRQFLAENHEEGDSMLAYKAVLSPVRRTPAELLAEIFSHVSAQRGVRTHVGTYMIDAPPWRLGHICRTWRNAALSSPRIWSRIRIFEPKEFGDASLIHTLHPLSMIETQLMRSGNTLDIGIDLQFDHGLVKVDHHIALLDMLVQQSHRWSVFRANFLGEHPDLVPIFSVVNGRVPNLRQFQLINNNIAAGQEHPFPTDAPALREILLTERQLGFESLYLRTAPWHQITRYRATLPEHQQFTILLAAANLVDCALGFASSEAIEGDKHAFLPHLRRLCVGDGHSDILKKITAPTLKSLAVCTPWRAVPRFIYRCSAGQFLTRLFLEDEESVRAEPIDVVNILREAAALEELGISCGIEDLGAVWIALMVEPGRSNLCPELRSLVYICRDSREVIEASFFPMVLSRLVTETDSESDDDSTESDSNDTPTCLEYLRVVAAAYKVENFVNSVKRGMRLLPDDLDAELLEEEEAVDFWRKYNPM